MAKRTKNQISLSNDKAVETGITALYARVSTDAQFEEGYSLDAQIERMHKYCESKGFDNCVEYPDGGFSGASLDRPGIKKLIEDIELGKVKRVVVFKLDRLSRSQRDTVTLLEDVFLPNDVDFISLSENFDTGTPYGKAMIGVFSVFAQLERENIYERTRMGMLERVKSGKWPGGGGTPFGYDYDAEHDRLVPNEHAEEVRQIYDLYLSGYSTTQLATMFPVANDHQITQILDRQTYLGKISYNGELYQGNHEAIIDESTWSRVQEERRRRSTKNAVTSQYLLTGLVYCGKCGAKMRYQKWGKGLKLWCYSQQTSKPNLVKDPDCSNERCNAWELEQLVVEDLLRLCDDVPTQPTGIVELSKKQNNSVNSIQARCDALTAKINRLYHLYGENEDQLLLQVIKESNAERDALLRMLENEKASASAIQNVAERQEAMRNLRDRWDSLSIREKQRVLRLCIDRITVTDGAVDIAYAL